MPFALPRRLCFRHDEMRLIERLLHSGLLYDIVQHAVGADLIRRHLTPVMAGLGDGLVLDVGAGTGLYTSCIPSVARYVWYDRDVQKLRRFRTHHRSSPAVLGDATRLAFRDKSVDWTLCVNLTHHLSDPELDVLLKEICRITRRTTVIHDPIAVNRRVSSALWRYDRGSHPRTREAMLSAAGSHLVVRRVIEFGRFHRYLLMVGEPT